MSADSYELTLDYSMSSWRTLSLPSMNTQYAEVSLGTDSLSTSYSLSDLMKSLSLTFDWKRRSVAGQSMLVSEKVLARDWNSPEEDEAWADL